MKKKHVSAAIAALMTIASSLMVAGLLYFTSQRLLIYRILIAVEAAKGEATPTLVMSSLTDFEWDKLYVIGPYASPRLVNAELGYQWLDPNNRYFAASDSHNTLVFLKNGRVIRYYELARFIDFRDLDSQRMFFPGEDAFRIKFFKAKAGKPTRADLVPLGVPSPQLPPANGAPNELTRSGG